MILQEHEIEAVVDSRFSTEWDLKWINVEGKCISLSWYILLMCIDDLEQYVYKGKKSHIEWRVKPIKDYFNLSGTARQLLEKLNELKKMYE